MFKHKKAVSNLKQPLFLGVTGCCICFCTYTKLNTCEHKGVKQAVKEFKSADEW